MPDWKTALYGSDQTFFGVPIGSWGTPEFGATEALANVVGAPTDPVTGGSQLFSGGTSQPNLVSTDPNANPWAGSVQPYTGSQSFGDPSNPDLSNPVKQTDWENYQQSQQQPQQQQADPYAQLRGEISSGWDQYIASLDQMLNQGLTGQRTAQEGIAQSQYGQGQNVLGTQLGEGQALLGTQRERTQQNQAKTLRDLSANISNMFKTGNVMLGSMGAGDSSAANQYSYALTKMGSKQRGDVMSQGADIMKEIDARESSLKNIYDSEIRNLGFERDQKIGQIATWFSDAQNQLRQAQASGQLGKSQDLANVSRDILTQAQNQLAQIDSDSKSRYQALEQWAINSSNSIAQLKQNMQGIQQYAPQMPGYSPMQGSPQVDSRGNLNMPVGYGSAEEKQPLFQNPSWLSG